MCCQLKYLHADVETVTDSQNKCSRIKKIRKNSPWNPELVRDTLWSIRHGIPHQHMFNHWRHKAPLHIIRWRRNGFASPLSLSFARGEIVTFPRVRVFCWANPWSFCKNVMRRRTVWCVVTGEISREKLPCLYKFLQLYTSRVNLSEPSHSFEMSRCRV